MATACPHENTIEVGDMPMADPTTFEILGRFDVTMCIDCYEVLQRTLVVTPEVAAEPVLPQNPL